MRGASARPASPTTPLTAASSRMANLRNASLVPAWAVAVMVVMNLPFLVEFSNIRWPVRATRGDLSPRAAAHRFSAGSRQPADPEVLQIRQPEGGGDGGQHHGDAHPGERQDSDRNDRDDGRREDHVGHDDPDADATDERRSGHHI